MVYGPGSSRSVTHWGSIIQPSWLPTEDAREVTTADGYELPDSRQGAPQPHVAAHGNVSRDGNAMATATKKSRHGVMNRAAESSREQMKEHKDHMPIGAAWQVNLS